MVVHAAVTAPPQARFDKDVPLIPCAWCGYTSACVATASSGDGTVHARRILCKHCDAPNVTGVTDSSGR